jgi:hypothetical protein
MLRSRQTPTCLEYMAQSPQVDLGDLNDPTSTISRVFEGPLKEFITANIGWYGGPCPVDDSGLAKYARDASIDIPQLRKQIQTHVGLDIRNVGLDIAGGSNGRALKDMIDEGFIGRGMYTNLKDDRNKEIPRHDVRLLTGNLLLRKTWEDMIGWQQSMAPDGFSIVLHRPRGSFQYLPPFAYVALTGLVVSMMKPGGIFFTQIPGKIRNESCVSKSKITYKQTLSLPGVQKIEPVGQSSFSARPEFCMIYKRPDTHGLC